MGEGRWPLFTQIPFYELTLIEIARIKGRENLVAVVVSYTQAPSMYFATLTNNKLSIIRQARNIGAIEPRLAADHISDREA